MKIRAHPRPGGYGGPRHKDLLDICKIFESFSRSSDAHFDLDRRSPEFRFLIDELDSEMHALLLPKARGLAEDEETAKEVAVWELKKVQLRMRGGLQSRSARAPPLHLGAFDGADVQKLAKRYLESFKAMVEILEVRLFLSPFLSLRLRHLANFLLTSSDLRT
jgi:hypothetical protein